MSNYFIELVKQDDGDLFVCGYVNRQLVKICTIKGIYWLNVASVPHRADHHQWVADLLRADWQSEFVVDLSRSGTIREILDQIQKQKQEDTPEQAYDRAMGVIRTVPKTLQKDLKNKDPAAPVQPRQLTPEEVAERKAYDRAMRSVS